MVRLFFPDPGVSERLRERLKNGRIVKHRQDVFMCSNGKKNIKENPDYEQTQTHKE